MGPASGQGVGGGEESNPPSNLSTYDFIVKRNFHDFLLDSLIRRGKVREI
jgi:hypothetical protein